MKQRILRNSWHRGEDVTVVRSIPVVTRNSEHNPVSLYRDLPELAWIAKAPTMNRKASLRRTSRRIVLTLTAGCCLVGATGCQVSLNGQTLPSPYYLQDDVQYFPSGPEFKLPREAAALRAARAEEKLNRR